MALFCSRGAIMPQQPCITKRDTGGAFPPVEPACGNLTPGTRSSHVAYDQHASPRARVALYRCPVRCLRSSAGFTKVMPQGPIPCTCTTVSSLVRKEYGSAVGEHDGLLPHGETGQAGEKLLAFVHLSVNTVCQAATSIGPTLTDQYRKSTENFIHQCRRTCRHPMLPYTGLAHAWRASSHRNAGGGKSRHLRGKLA